MPFLRSTLPALFAAVLLWAAPALAAGLPAGTLDFDVIRNGEKIGTHTLRFQPQGNALMVDIQTRVAVSMAFITVYRFEHDGHEEWSGGHLVTMNSATNDDGTYHAVDARADTSGLHIEADGTRSTADARIIPASLWNPDLVRQGTLLNTLDGSQMAVRVDLLGMETVNVAGQNVAASHYRVSGDLAREVWYDANDRLVQVRFSGKDGSPIEYRLR